MQFSRTEKRIHVSMLERARAVSTPLYEAITLVGPVSSRGREPLSIENFLARAIIGQQVSAAAARSIWGRVADAAGAARVDAPTLAQRCIDQVLACGVSGNKARALQCVYEASRSGRLSETLLQKQEPCDRVATLLAIRGVGPWTCDMALLFHYHLPDIWPEGDAAVQRTFQRLIGRRSSRRVAKLFIPYRSSLALSMWRHVELFR